MRSIIMTAMATISLQLVSVAEILTDGAADSAASSPLPRSGLDELLLSARDIPADTPLRIVLRLPPEEINGQTAETIRRALAAQCAERIDTSKGIMTAIREKTTSRLLTSLFIVAGLLVVVFLLIFTLTSLEFLRPILGGAIALGVWAILANPIKTYQRHWQPHKRQIADCRRIMAAAINIEAA